MKRLILTLVLLLGVIAISYSATPVKNPNVAQYREAILLGGEHSYFYYEGQDTVTTGLYVDTLGFDSVLSTGALDIGWLSSDSTGTYPNWTEADSLTWHNPTLYWLWLQMDTLIYRGDWDTEEPNVRDTLNADSVGFSQIIVEYALTVQDVDSSWSASFADTSNIVAADGQWLSEDYGVWTYEELIGAITTPNMIDHWWIYNLKVPAGGQISSVKIYAPLNMVEAIIYRWRVVCAH